MMCDPCAHLPMHELLIGSPWFFSDATWDPHPCGMVSIHIWMTFWSWCARSSSRKPQLPRMHCKCKLMWVFFSFMMAWVCPFKRPSRVFEWELVYSNAHVFMFVCLHVHAFLVRLAFDCVSVGVCVHVFLVCGG